METTKPSWRSASAPAQRAVHLLPMLERIKANAGKMPAAQIADASYRRSAAKLEACEKRGLEA